MRRATQVNQTCRTKISISIHALLAESDIHYDNYNLHCVEISIHALLAESDGGSSVGSWPRVIFLSTLSLRRATEVNNPVAASTSISIHALLAESDSAPRFTPAPSRNFYPRSPCGERLDEIPYQRQINQFLSTLSLRRATPSPPQNGSSIKFLSTLSLRRATNELLEQSASYNISIHALLAESDAAESAFVGNQVNFYPRSPCGERRKITITVDEGTLISIHALLAESDRQTVILII